MYIKNTASFLIILLFTPFLLAGSQAEKQSDELIERGKYIVFTHSCRDCHSPKIFTEKGPQIDEERLLSGHPAEAELPPIPSGVTGRNQWGGLSSHDMTAWVGPWGVSFTRNLTPDLETGLGSWTEQMFIQTIRTGKHMGVGRRLLPPMPSGSLSHLTDDDLKAIWAYLRTVKPVHNAVPDPIPAEIAFRQTAQ